jgi:hypothetical protein
MATITESTQTEMDAEAITPLKRAKRDFQPYGLWNFGENAWTDVYNRADAHKRSFSCSQTFSAIFCGNLRPSGLTTSRVSVANAIEAL